MRSQRFRVTIEVEYEGHSDILTTQQVKEDLSVDSQADAAIFTTEVTKVQEVQEITAKVRK